MNLEDCRPGVIVMWGERVGVVYQSDPTTIGMPRAHVRLEGLPRNSSMALPCADLELAPRFLVNGEWVADHSPWLCSGYVVYVGNEFPEKPWGWLTGNTIGRATTFAAAREAVEKAVGLGRSGSNDKSEQE